MGLSKLSGFIEILKETINILKSKNGKLIAKICSIHIILISVALISHLKLNTFLQHDLLVKETFMILKSPPPSFTEIYASIKPDIILLLVVGLLFNLFSVILFIFAMTSTILASAATYSSEPTILSFKELMMKVKASIKRPIVTILYIYLIGMGFIFVGLCLFGILSLLVENRSVLLMFVVGIPSTILWMYLSVVFILAFPVSIIEEGVCGIQAIAKAGRLVKGKRMDGFLWNLVASIATVIALIPYVKMYMSNNQEVYKMLTVVVMSTFSGILGMFQHMFYTVLYFQCKKSNDISEIGLMGVYEYVKLPYVDQELP